MYRHDWKNRLLQALRPLQMRIRQVRSWMSAQPLTMTTGILQGSDQEIRMLSLGSSNLLQQAFFDAGHTTSEVLGYFQPSQSADILKQYGTQADLMLLPHTPFAPAATASTLLVPDYLDATIWFNHSEEQWHQHLRTRNKQGLRYAAKRAYQFHRETTEEDYRRFYDDILKPFVHHRHGYSAYVESCAAFCADTYGAVLETVRLEQKSLAGFHLKLSPRNPLAYFNKVGISTESIQDKQIMSELNCLIYQRMVQLARSEGHHGLHLGITPPILNNGITWYKSGWGAEFVPNLTHQRYQLHFTSAKAALIRQHAAPLVALKNGHLIGIVWGEALDAADKIASAEPWKFNGLHSIHCHSIQTGQRVQNPETV